MSTRITAAVAIGLGGALLHCGAPAPAPVVAVPPVASTLAPASAASSSPPLVSKGPPRESKPIALAGPNIVQNAVWIENGALAAVTSTAVWRVRPEAPERVTMTPLERPLGGYAVIAGAESSSLVAVALDDGRVEVLDQNGHKYSLAPGEKVHLVLDMKLSPDAKLLAITRDGPTWREETTFFDVATGAALGKVDGGNVVFDPTSKYTAGRGGVATPSGTSVATFREGFYVLGGGGKFVPVEKAGSGEMMAGDYVARGWFRGLAVYAGDQSVELIDPATGTSTPIDAKCGPGKKISSTADLAHARVIGVCEDAILITDLKTRSTRTISASVQKGGTHFPIKVYVAPGGEDAFGLTSGRKNVVVIDGALQSEAVAGKALLDLQAMNDPNTQCLRATTPRTAIECSIPALRRDRQYSAHVRSGLTVDSGAGKNVVDWSSSTRSWRVDRTPMLADGCGRPPASLGTKQWSEQQRADTFTAYSSITASGGRVTAHLTCICTAGGCTKNEILGFADDPFAFRDDGTILTESTNPTMTETTFALRRPQKPSVRGKIAESCLHGFFGPNGRVFLLCTANERATVYELGANDLALVAKRVAPPIGVTEIEFHNGELVLHGATGTMLAPVDWVKDPTLTERASIYGVYGASLTVMHDGKIDIQGSPSEVAPLLRCYDGERLRPFATCK